MPYYIAQNTPDCKSGWAVIDADGAAYGCHQTKQDAIDQAIAISIATDEPFEGERSVNDIKVEEPMVRTDQADVEVRFNAAQFEVREEDDGMRFSGYAAVFNSPSEPLPFTERIAPGAFKRSLRARNDIKLLWNHDTGAVLGSTRARTVTLVEDDHGLRVDAILPNTSLGRDTAELLRRGDVDSMSFGFTVPPGGDVWNADGTERTLKSIRLFEISVVAFPAYSATAGTTSVRARSFDKLAERTQVDVNALADALLKIENGEDITIDDRNLLTEVIDKLAPEQMIIDVEPEVETNDLSMLLLKKKKLELLKGI